MAQNGAAFWGGQKLANRGPERSIPRQSRVSRPRRSGHHAGGRAEYRLTLLAVDARMFSPGFAGKKTGAGARHTALLWSGKLTVDLYWLHFAASIASPAAIASKL